MYRPSLVFIAVLAVALLSIGCQDDSVRVEEHQASGEAHLEAEEWTEAKLEFQNVTSIDPNNADAHFGLAKAFIGLGSARKAFWELEDVVRLDPSNVEARLQHAQFLLLGAGDDVGRVIESADAVLAIEPERWEARILKARALEQLERVEEATPIYRAAAESADEDKTPILLYANHLRQQGDTEGAEAQYRAFSSASPGFAGQAALAGFLASLPDREDEAEAAHRTAVEVAADGELKPAYSLLVNFLVGKRRLDEAEQELLAAIDQVPGDQQLLYSLAQFYSAQGRISEADAIIERASESAPDDAEPLLLLSAYRGFHGDLDGALEAAEKAVEVDPASVIAKLRRSEVLLDKGYALIRSGDDSGRTMVARARASVDAVLANDDSEPQALFVKAKIDLAENDAAAAVANLRRAIDGKRDFAQAHYVLSSALYVQGDRQGARVEATRALEINPNLVEARRLLARLHGELGDHALAVQEGRVVLKARPGEAATRVIVAQSLLRQGEVDAALVELDAIPAEARTHDVHYAVGRTLQYAQRGEEARPHLEAANRGDAANPEILRALLQLDVSENRVQESIDRIEAAVTDNPESAKLLLLQGEVAMLTRQVDVAEAAFRKTLELDPNALDAYQRLASLYVLTGRSDQVVTTYEEALERNPKSGVVHLNLALLYEIRNRYQDAQARYESAIELQPDLAVAKNNLAYLIAEHGGDLDRALDLAQEAKSALPSNPNTADTLGWVLFKKGVPGAAVVHLREAVGGFPPDSPNTPVVRLHLALAYEADGNPAAAQEQLERASSEVNALIEGQRVDPENPPEWFAEIEGALARLRGQG